jgi:hypothetical protein
MTKTIPYFIQIVAITYDGTNLLWDSNKRDFVGFEKDVPQTDLNDLDSAQDFASKHYSNIFEVWAEFINLETNELVNVVKNASEGDFYF